MNPQLIAEIAALIAQLGPLGMQLFLKLEGSLNLTSDEKTNIANAIAAANTADDDVIALVAAWAEKNGMVMKFAPAQPPAPGATPPAKQV